MRDFNRSIQLIILMALVSNLAVSAPAISNLHQVLSHVVEWRTFWSLPTHVKQPPAGTRIPALLVDFGAECVVFLAPLRLRIHLAAPANDQTSIRAVNTATLPKADDTNELAFRRFLLEQRASEIDSAGVHISEKASQSQSAGGRRVPAERARLPQRDIYSHIRSTRTFTFVMPPVTENIYLSAEAVSAAGLEEFANTICEMLKSYVPRAAEVVLPRFSALDPAVFVLVESQGKPIGVVPFRRYVDGSWLMDKLIYDTPKNNLSRLISRIRQLEAAKKAIH